MLYPRLKVARNLLADDGAIIISIDEHEHANVRKICDELFGKDNFRNTLLTRRRVKSLNSQFSGVGLYSMNVGFEYVLIYAKSRNFLMKALSRKKQNSSAKGRWNVFWSNSDRPTMRYHLLGFKPVTGQWRWSEEKALEAVSNYQEYVKNFSKNISLEDYWRKTGKKLKFVRRIADGKGKNGGVQYWVPPSDTVLRTSNWMDIEVSQIKKDFNLPFDNPKSVDLVMELLSLNNSKNYTVLDFFAGSSTTADCAMRLNAKDGGNRNYIMVQLDENIGKDTAAYNAGFKTISDLSRERIRLAGKKVLEGECHPNWNRDVGFRALRVDSSNMKDVYYHPDKIQQSNMLNQIDNVKEGRTSEDLLFQVMLNWGVDLTLPISSETVLGRTVFFVNNNALVACFEKDITEELVRKLAGHRPLRMVFHDSGFNDDDLKINVEQLLRQLSPNTDIRVI
ncbi:MAG: site-specific DNA-methyltransferase [Rhodobacteraceae bacterium]|nr:site-specific DNA-methyltransferase [Paracoccaceae bacterium]